jgi:hypothetical protein
MKDIDLQDLVGKLEADDFLSSLPNLDCSSLGNISCRKFALLIFK